MEDIKRSHEIAKKTLGFLSKHALESTPVNFEVIYTYTQAHNKSLILAVNQVIRSEVGDKSKALENIHSKLISSSAATNKVDEITNQMSDEVNQITAMISAAMGETNTYSEKLGEVSDELSSSVDSDAVKVIVESLMLATENMKENSSLLESKLAESNRQISELSENLSDVRAEARTDQLTGIANRKHFDEAIDSEITTANSNGSELCVLMGDIDHFKRFNDTFGHQTGDQVLRLVASCLSEGVKSHHLVARYGGEEFAIVLPKTSLSEAQKIADRIRMAVEGKELIKRSTGENLGTITICFGAALYRASELSDDIISRADDALYYAKHSGRNQVKTEEDLPEENKAQA